MLHQALRTSAKLGIAGQCRRSALPKIERRCVRTDAHSRHLPLQSTQETQKHRARPVPEAAINIGNTGNILAIAVLLHGMLGSGKDLGMATFEATAAGSALRIGVAA